MRGLRWMWAAGALAVSAPAVCGTDEIALVGLDQGQNSVETSIPADEYLRRLSTAVASVRDTTFEVLARRDTPPKALKPWNVHTVVVGVGAELEAGVGPVIKVKAAPRFRLVFSDSDDPALP